MNKTFKFSLKDSQISQGEQKDPLRSSQLSVLNLNQLKGSIASYNPKSDRTPRKLNYKYERVNNSFRLVQVDPSDSDNKQNMFAGGLDDQLKCEKKSQVLLTLNALTERVERLEKNQKYDDQKLQFNMHRLVEKVINEQSSVSYSKCQPLEKRMEGILYQIGELKQKVKSLSIIPNYIADSELHVIRKCKLNLDDSICEMRDKLAQSQLEHMYKLHQKLSFQMSNLMDRKLTDVARNFQGSLGKMAQSIESHFEQIKVKEIKGISHHHHSSHAECKESRNKIEAELQIIYSKLNEKTEAQKVEKCDKQLIAQLLVSIGVRKLESCLRVDQKESHTLVYGLDPNGFIVDCEGYYLLNSKGEPLQLNHSHLQKLQQMGVIHAKTIAQ